MCPSWYNFCASCIVYFGEPPDNCNIRDVFNGFGADFTEVFLFPVPSNLCL